MLARLTTIVFDRGERVDGETLFRQIRPAVADLGGFKGMLFLSSEDGSRLQVLTLWEDAQALEAAAPTLEGIKRAETAFRRVETHETELLHVDGWEFAGTGPENSPRPQRPCPPRLSRC